MKTLELGNHTLALEDVEAVSQNNLSVTLSSEAKRKMERSRALVDEKATSGHDAYYGINTGFGSLKNVRIGKGRLEELQTNLIRSHAVGVGPLLSTKTVRAMMLLRAQTLALGYSGVHVETVETLLSLLNKGVIPCVPSQGSVGASGDLAPLAHLALAMIGEGEVEFDGSVLPAGEALKKAKIRPIKPEAKEALALLNGTQMMLAIATLALLEAERLMTHADVAAAMTLEATFGSPTAFDERVHALRPHPGQRDSAANLFKLTQGSEICKSHENCDRVQDAYSIRCAPQVHGAARDSLRFVRGVLEIETNSVTDNPLIFAKEGDVVSAGNFHGQPVANAMDTMALALTSVASISERRIFRMLSPTLSELPAGLVVEPGLNSGLMMLQVTAASLVSECKTLSHPASVDSIPTWADQEDHVSMGAWAARKASTIVDNLRNVISIELLCGAQALEFRKPLHPGKGVQAAFESIRSKVKVLEKDRILGPDLDAILGLVNDQGIRTAVEAAIGNLR